MATENATLFVNTFMQALADGYHGAPVVLNPQLQAVFARVLSRQVSFDENDQAETTPAFNNLAPIFTFILSPVGERPLAPTGANGYTPAQLDAARDEAQAAVAPPGVTLTLTPGTDFVGPEEPADPSAFDGEIFLSTDENNTIEGEVSASSADRTLNTTDQIDGGGGENTLDVTMNASFAGFNGDGGLTNVQTVNLTNSGSSVRNFNATGVEGVQTYNLSGPLSLSELASLAPMINLADRASGTATLTFQAGVTTPGGSTLNLGFENLGSSNNDVTVTADDANDSIENLTAMVTGDNWVALDNNGYETITTSGEGNLALDATALVGNVVSSVDASAQTGNFGLMIDSGSLVSAAEIRGGTEGANSLTLDGVSATTTTYQMSGIQTLRLQGNSDALVFSGINVTGLTNIELADDFVGAAVANNLGNVNLGVTLEGENTNGGSLAVGNSAETRASVEADAGATELQDNNTGITADQAAALTLEVSEMSSYQGAVSADNATSFEIIADGQVTLSTVALGTNALDAVMTFNHATEDSDLNLTAADLDSLTVATESDLNLTGSTLTALTDLEVTTDGTFTGVDLAAAQNITLDGSGQVVLGNLGGGAKTTGLTFAADGLTGTTAVPSALNVGTITDNKSANTSITLTDITGDVTLGAIETRDLTLNAAVDAGTLTIGVITNARHVNVTASVTGDETEALTIGAMASADGDLRDVSVDLSGTSLRDGTDFGTVTVSPIGATNAARNVTIDVSAVEGDVTTLAADATDDVTIDASGLVQATGTGLTITVGANTSSETATITGANGSENTIDVTVTDEATVNGGGQSDTITVTGDAADGSTATFNIDLVGGASGNTITFDTITNGKVRGLIDGFVVGRDTQTTADFTWDDVSTRLTNDGGTDLTDARTEIVSWLSSAGVTASGTQITNVFELSTDNGATVEGYLFQFGGSTHIITDANSIFGNADGADDAFGDGDYFLTLTGVTGITDQSTAESVFGI
ncbi:MAG: hypothetical protein VBE63_00020 [Lamprobacter sp.]|uniref:beta strand repeat-containing protein n=1 Tax=Lamprobacter sp. TaxID=3100796 RepID=UPI002B2645CE|nr:hypothetical protein [Lamprobacter sp.]MEA3638311.1 hypothetical protein [Lamprobacter sp.]